MLRYICRDSSRHLCMAARWDWWQKVKPWSQCATLHNKGFVCSCWILSTLLIDSSCLTAFLTYLLTDDLPLNKNGAENSDSVCFWGRFIYRWCYFWSTALLLLFERHSVQVWVGVDIHWLLNDSVICVVGLSTEGCYVAGNCCGGRLGFVLSWAARCCPALSFSPTLSPCLSGFIP